MIKRKLSDFQVINNRKEFENQENRTENVFSSFETDFHAPAQFVKIHMGILLKNTEIVLHLS